MLPVMSFVRSHPASSPTRQQGAPPITDIRANDKRASPVKSAAVEMNELKHELNSDAEVTSPLFDSGVEPAAQRTGVGGTDCRNQKSATSNLPNLVEKSLETRMTRCRVPPKKSSFKSQVYNFLERPTGWKCFVYHFLV